MPLRLRCSQNWALRLRSSNEVSGSSAFVGANALLRRPEADWQSIGSGGIRLRIGRICGGLNVLSGPGTGPAGHCSNVSPPGSHPAHRPPNGTAQCLLLSAPGGLRKPTPGSARQPPQSLSGDPHKICQFQAVRFRLLICGDALSDARCVRRALHRSRFNLNRSKRHESQNRREGWQVALQAEVLTRTWVGGAAGNRRATADPKRSLALQKNCGCVSHLAGASTSPPDVGCIV